MKMKTASLLVSVVVLNSGCAAFRANNLPVVSDDEFNLQAQEKAKVYSKWQLESDSSLANDQAKVAAAAIHKDMFEKALSESGCCVVVESKSEADVVVNGTAIDENNPAAMIPAVITGLSLFTIPSWVTATVHIQVEANSGEKSASYDLSDSMTMVQWLPMIFAMPFTGAPIDVGKEVDSNVYKNLVLKMKEDELLD